jgi:hypothetical protein
MRRQILRQRKEIHDLQRAGTPTKSADELLGRMLAKVDGLSIERERLVGEQRRKYPGTNKVINRPIERRFSNSTPAIGKTPPLRTAGRAGAGLDDVVALECRFC